jgi:hypothetical protein
MRLSTVLDDLDLSHIQDPAARTIIQQLLNLVEELADANRALREENQRLRDENNHLKGEQGQPSIKPNSRRATTNHSSEAERRQPTPRGKRSKRSTITIDREATCRLDPAILPPDAQFKGYLDVVVQDVVLRTDNVLFHKEKWYAPSTRRTYLADLPLGYDDTFGPHIKALALTLAYDIKVSQPQILALFRQAGSDLAAGTLVGWLTHDLDRFHAEKDALYEAGLRSSPYQQTDHTATRDNRQNQHCQIVCNPLYTIYQTVPHKDRLSVLDVLRNRRPRTFLLNDEAHHRRLLKRFRARFWRYYHALRRDQSDLRPRARIRLERWFERLFASETGYRALDERIAKTRAKKAALLQVLTHPEIPLHNNAAELAARARVRKRDVSFGPRTAAGTKAWDTFQSLAATAKKLGVRFYDYLHDRISGANALPSLADLITQRANELALGASWAAV